MPREFPHHTKKKARLAAGLKISAVKIKLVPGCRQKVHNLLHRVSIGIDLVDLTQIQFPDTSFYLAHVAHNYPDHVIGLN